MSFELLLALLAGATAVAGLARRLHLPAPLVLVVAGLIVGLIPGVPRFEFDPDTVLVVILPLLLYAAALSTAFADFRDNLGPIGLLSVGLVLVTTVVVGLVAAAIVSDLPLAAAMAMGAIVAPPDAIAATGVARKLGLPRRVLTILEGESLLNDATALVSYRIAVAAAVASAATWTGAVRDFAVAALGGVAVGLVLAWVIAKLRRRLHDPMVENALSLLTPFAAYLPAEHMGASGVLAVVVAGLYLGRRAPVLLSSNTRLQGQAMWGMVSFLLEGLVFGLIGLQLPTVLDGLHGRSPGEVAVVAAAVTLTVIGVRLAWVFLTTYVPRRVDRWLRRPDPIPDWRHPALVGWAGMRGVVSLAAAFALPEDMPGRELILFVTFCVILTTLLLQGLTLPWVVRKLGLADSDAQDRLERHVAVADHHVARFALGELERIQHDDPLPDAVESELRGHLEERVRRAHAILGGCPGEDEYDDGVRLEDERSYAESEHVAEVRRQLVDAERGELVRLYNERDINDEVLRRMQRQLDLEELQLHV